MKISTQLADIMQQGDLNAFMHLVETEALSLHAMMMTANPYFISDAT
jgi:diphosphomevalonate decarboxylase